jgi:hypothetical protein
MDLSFLHKEQRYMYTDDSVCPIVGIGTLPPPSLASECALPPGIKEEGGGAHSPAGGGLGVGGVPIQTTGEKA